MRQLTYFTHSLIYLCIFPLPNFAFSTRGRGHSHVRGIWVCAALMTPFSGSSTAPETHFFTPISVSSYALLYLFLNSASLGPFLSDFGKISAPNTHTNFDKNLFPVPLLFKKKICSVDPTFENLCSTYPPKKKFEFPPPQFSTSHSYWLVGLLRHFTM